MKPHFPLARSSIFVTSRGGRAGKGALLVIVKGGVADKISEVLCQIPEATRREVTEVSAVMAAPLKSVISRCFPQAHRVVDRFHVQQLAFDMIQEVHIALKWQAQEAEYFGRKYWRPEIL